MLKPIQPVSTNANYELLKIWIARYLPALENISSHIRRHTEQRLRSSISDNARLTTAQTIKRNLVTDCTAAAAETKQLLTTTEAFFKDFQELQELSTKILRIYRLLIDYYETSFIFSPVIEYIHLLESTDGKLEVSALVMPQFEKLMLTLGPLVRELKAIYFSSVNRHLIGFMTTQIHLTRKQILSHLTPYECTWIAPYLEILDEMICMPWPRICSVAASEVDRTDAIALVKKMMPRVNTISALTYQQAIHAFPHHISCQGRLQSAAVQSSSLRDLNMFQAYIWLCILEGSPAVIEKQLLPLCRQVFYLTNVQWSLANFGVKTIINTIHQQLDTNEQQQFDPHAKAVQQLFLDAEHKPGQLMVLKQHLKKENASDAVSYTWRPN